MKQKTITTAKATLLVVELPDGATQLKIEGSDIRFCYILNGDWVCHWLPQGKWQLLGRLPDITESQASEVVDSTDYDESRKLYTNYVNKRWTAFALNSLSSLLQANEVCFENPYRDPGLMPSAELDAYRKAQSKVWDKERTYLFIKED